MPNSAARPIAVGEVAPAFDLAFRDASHVVLAVSGGADSTALVHLALAWRDRRGLPAPIFSIATIDHGLRAESAQEARTVAEAAARLGLPHTTLVWQGPKPQTGVQAAARDARYRLLIGHARAISSADAVVATAHTLDDQAETVLMRLARGSGIDGLTGIEPIRSLDPAISLARPLLQVPKARLVAMLRKHGIGWIEDPSNEMPAYERVRWRQALPLLDAQGLTSAHIATSARRLARARQALETIANEVIEAAGPDELRLDQLGYVAIDWPWLLRRPAEVRLRILSCAIETVGGGDRPPSLGRLEAMTEQMAWQEPAGRTLAGVAFISRGGRLFLVRERGRDRAAPRITVIPGSSVVWDGRFHASLASSAPRPMLLAALGSDGLAQFELRGLARPALAPARVLHALPAFWEDGTAVACPPLGWFADGAEPEHYRCRLARQLTVTPRPQF